MTKRILLAEEDRQLVAAIVERLRPLGFEVSHVSDGIEALQAIALEIPDLLLLELKLPGLHGIELIRKLGQSPRSATLPVIVLTGFYKGEKFQAAAKALGVRYYFEKPFKATDLITAIQQTINPAGTSLAKPETETRLFAQHLRKAFMKHFSGLLTLQYPETVHMLTFINGAPFAIRPGFKNRDFGDFLYKRGQITLEEYNYFTTSADYRSDSLVQIGCLRHSDLLQAEMDYLHEELVSAFGGGPARASWKVIPAPDLLQMITLNVPQLFYDGFHRHSGTTSALLLQTFRDKFILLDKDYFRHINFLGLNEIEKHFIRSIDGQHKLADLIRSEEEYGPLLLTLTSLNMVRFAAQPTPSANPQDLPLRTLFNVIEEEVKIDIDESLESFSDLVNETEKGADFATTIPLDNNSTPTVTAQSSPANELSQEVRLIAKSLEDKNHYEVFGIKQAKFSIALLKDRYFAITRKFGPEVLIQLYGEEAHLVEEILSKVATAYDTLSDVIKKERYDEMLGTDKIGLGHKGDEHFQAQVQAESGKVFLEMGDWDNAEKSLQEAVNAAPNNGAYLANLAWAVYRNPKYANSQAMLNKAKQMLNKSISMERTAEAFAYKGWMLLEVRQESMAEAEFNKALKMDARNSAARKGLRTLQELQEQQKKGIFKRMFK